MAVFHADVAHRRRRGLMDRLIVLAIHCMHVFVTLCDAAFRVYSVARTRKASEPPRRLLLALVALSCICTIFMQVVAGPHLHFFNAVASWPGSVRDSRIFVNSRLRVLYEELRVPGVLLGDMVYACFPFLMAPLADPGTEDTPERRYKARIKTRNSVERAFGVWKRRFPCLDMKLQHKPERAARVITACAALHNLVLSRGEPEPLDTPALRASTIRCRRMGRNTCEEHLPPVKSLGVNLSGMRARQQLIGRSFS
ncbi:putative nuclease HARBI1 [Rhipicephalus sanguineus]|uniref:putative nuclease HARBI1 n=1 Tax=Rhipicephalus sanguineus TaxID=34632 RepID=UPI0020C2F9F2|nr:putative nuclease HARBI1 [Rhipicephalus sanguineus]